MEALLPTSFKAVGNHAFIDFPSATMDGYELPSGIYVARRPTDEERIEDNAAVVGTVVSVADGFHMKKLVGENSAGPVWSYIPIALKAGDKVAVDYRVVGDGEWKGDMFQHKNCVLIYTDTSCKMVWTAEADTMMAVKRGDTWTALGDYVLLKKCKRLKYQSSLIIIPDSVQEEEEKNVAEHVSGLDAGVGTKVFYHPEFATSYTFEQGEEMLVIRTDWVFGTIGN